MDYARTHHVKMYCVWLFLKFTSGARPIGMPLASLSYAVKRSGTTARLGLTIVSAML